MNVNQEVDAVLDHLRNAIRNRGFTQLEVQETLGWGRSYVSQLLTKQKSLRVEQVLAILAVLGVEPSDFFAGVFPQAPGAERDGSFAKQLARLLIRKGLLDEDDLAELQAAGAD